MSLATRLAQLFSIKTDLSYGLEITDSVIRLAAVQKHSKQAAPKILYEQPIHFIPTSLQDVNVTPEIKGVLKHIVQHYGIDAAHVGIPERHFFFRCIRVPKVSGPEAETTLQTIIDDYLTSEVVLPRSDVVCEYDIVAEEGGAWFVAVAVVPKFILRRYFSLLELVRVKPITIEANVHAMHRACIEDLAHNISMVVRIEHGMAHAAMVGGGAVLFDRDFVLPKNEQKRFVNEELTRFYRDWVRQPYRNQFERRPVQKITLFGGNDDLVMLQKEIEQTLRLPVRISQPRIGHIELDHDEVPPVHQEKMHRYSAVLGLALQGR